MPQLSRTALINASPEQVFAYVDDIRNLARHMSESPSMPMMGSKLKLEIVTPDPTGVGATYRYTVKMLGLVLDFSETVTTYIASREKIWRTIGEPKLLIMRGYKMRVLVVPVPPATANQTSALTMNCQPPVFGGSRGCYLLLFTAAGA